MADIKSEYPAGFKSVQVAGFRLEYMAGFIGTHTLDPFAEKLTGWLSQETGKSREQKRSTKGLHADR